MGRKMWFIISPGGEMPKEPPFRGERPTFSTAGLSGRDIEMMRRAFEIYNVSGMKELYLRKLR